MTTYNLIASNNVTFQLTRDFSALVASGAYNPATDKIRMQCRFPATPTTITYEWFSDNSTHGQISFNAATGYVTFKAPEADLISLLGKASYDCRIERSSTTAYPAFGGYLQWNAGVTALAGDSTALTGVSLTGDTVTVIGETSLTPAVVPASLTSILATCLAAQTTCVTDAALSTTAMTNIQAAIASLAGFSDPGLPYNLDGWMPSAIMSAPKGLFVLNGAVVSLASLLSFSSAAKYTVGANGNYVLNAANGPAYDWSTGRPRLLVEANAATNAYLNSENLALSLSNGCTVSVAANALLGTLALATITQTANGTQPEVYNGALSVGAGGTSVATCAVIAGTGSTSVFIGSSGSVSGFGSNGNSTAFVMSGPGTLSQAVGSLWQLNNLSATVPTIVAEVKTSPSAETVQQVLYTRPSSGGSAGDTTKAGRFQLELGSVPSSYIPCGASPTTRVADVVTAASGLLALLTAPNATVAWRGTFLTGGGCFIGSTVANRVLYRPGYGDTGAYSASGGPITAYQLVASDTLGTAIAYGAGRKIAANGGAVVSDAGALFTSSDTGIQVGSYASGLPSNFYLDEIVVWPFYGSDAGVQAQARVYS